MIELKPSLRISSLLLLALWAHTPSATAATACTDGALSCGGDYSLTRVLIGASGIANLPSGDYSLSFAIGEDISGQVSTDATGNLVIGGYYGGHYGVGGNGGAFHLLNMTISTPTYHQNGVQVGVSLTPTLQLFFSDQVDPNTLKSGVVLREVTDHLGQPQNSEVPVQFTYDTSITTVTVIPQGPLLGNTLYEIVANEDLLSIDGFQLNTSGPGPMPFVTLLDPQQQNVVLYPFAGLGAAAQTAGLGSDITSVNLDIPSQSLSDYSAILSNQDPMNTPVRVDPQIIKTANAKALASGGPYAVPVGLQELVGYNHNGQAISALAQPTDFSFSFQSTGGLVGGAGSLVRSGTLALWALDQVHALWVKIPASQVSAGGVVTAPITQLSVYALMGSAAGSANDVFIFPNPWRPHGPQAGSGSGQTGTDSGGMTFTNIPSECTIKIYTINGDLVRQIRHSDTSGLLGQETWDGNNGSGNHAASGVYLWRVESSVDGKNGKLIIIR